MTIKLCCIAVLPSQEISTDQQNVDIIPRQSGKISVKFTARQFPTPSRESLAADEEAVSAVTIFVQLVFYLVCIIKLSVNRPEN